MLQAADRGWEGSTLFSFLPVMAVSSTMAVEAVVVPFVSRGTGLEEGEASS